MFTAAAEPWGLGTAWAPARAAARSAWSGIRIGAGRLALAAPKTPTPALPKGREENITPANTPSTGRRPPERRKQKIAVKGQGCSVLGSNKPPPRGRWPQAGGELFSRLTLKKLTPSALVSAPVWPCRRQAPQALFSTPTALAKEPPRTDSS